MCFCAETQDRTVDTMIFSHVLYQLSYLGISKSAPKSTPDRADQTGFEPAISCVTGRRVKPLRYWSTNHQASGQCGLEYSIMVVTACQQVFCTGREATSMQSPTPWRVKELDTRCSPNGEGNSL